MAVRSRRLLGPVALSTVALGLGPVPIDRTTVLRSLTFWHNDNTARSLRLQLNGTASANFFYQTAVVGSQAPLVLEVHWYFNPGDELFASVSGAALTGVANLTLFGALLDGVPS